MAPKRPTAKTSPSDEWKITDEWGIYDPAKAGIPALFARLGRPILRAAPSSARKERRRALRPERSSEGVGLAIAEARRRAGIEIDGDAPVELPPAGGNPARAMRLALRAQAAVNALGTPAAEPFVAPPQPPPPPAPARTAKAPASDVTQSPKKRTRKAPAGKATGAAGRDTSAVDAPRTTRRTRGPKSVATAEMPQTAPAADPVRSPGVAAAPEPAPVPPAPSPRRPRGPVPLAAWAHAIADTPAPEPRRSDKRGFWRGIFRIPAEVALVEYAHGAKIHRLLIEAGDDQLPDFI